MADTADTLTATIVITCTTTAAPGDTPMARIRDTRRRLQADLAGVRAELAREGHEVTSAAVTELYADNPMIKHA